MKNGCDGDIVNINRYMKGENLHLIFFGRNVNGNLTVENGRIDEVF